MRKLTQKDDIQELLVEKRLYIKNNDSYHRVDDIKYPIYGNILKFECDDRLTYIIEDYLLNGDIGGVFVKEKSPTTIWTDGETSIYLDLDETPNEYLSKLYSKQITNKTNQMKQEIELKEGMTARVEGGKVIIETKEWTPADGEFVTHKDGWMHIHRTTDTEGKMKYYVAVSPCGKIENPYSIESFIGYERELRGPATPVEIQKFHQLLERSGKKWNAELKMVENVKPEYKEGDFLRTKNGGVFIYKHKDVILVMDHAFLACGGSLMMDDAPACLTTSIDGYATDGQKQKLIDALAKDGKIWNATKKRIEDIQPKVVEMTMEQVCEKLGMNVKIVKK